MSGCVPARCFCLAFLFFSALAVCPGLYFRHHYFILVLPAVALLAGTGNKCALRPLSLAAQRCLNWYRLLVIAAALALPIVRYKKLFFEFSPVQVSRMVYAESPFPESVQDCGLSARTYQVQMTQLRY